MSISCTTTHSDSITVKQYEAEAFVSGYFLSVMLNSGQNTN